MKTETLTLTVKDVTIPNWLKYKNQPKPITSRQASWQPNANKSAMFVGVSRYGKHPYYRNLNKKFSLV